MDKRQGDGAACAACRTPYRWSDLVAIGVNDFLCRWHWDRHIERLGR